MALLFQKINRRIVPVPLKFVPFDKAYPPGWYQPGSNKLEYERSPIHQTWPEMEKLVDDGLVRNIGVSNFNVQSILELLSYCKYKPATLQGACAYTLAFSFY